MGGFFALFASTFFSLKSGFGPVADSLATGPFFALT
jgi:hypothetical protein